MSQPLTSLEIKVISSVLGVNYSITRQGSMRISACNLGDYRNNSVAYFFHKQNDGKIFIRREIKGSYSYFGAFGSTCYRGSRYIYVIHRKSATNDYAGFDDVMEAAYWLRAYIYRNC